MKRKMWRLVGLGFILGIAGGHLLTVIISLCIGDGVFHPVVPAMSQAMGGQAVAALVQTMLLGLLGSVQAVGSMIWRQDQWSLLKQTALHLLLVTLATLGIAYVCYWMEHSWAGGFLKYLGIFLAGYAIIWVSIVLSLKQKVARINEQLKR